MLSVADNSLGPRGDMFRVRFYKAGVCSVPDSKSNSVTAKIN